MADLDPNPATDVEAVGSSLCTQCGLCCMGVIHNAATLEPEEIPAARGLGLDVTIRDEGKSVFALPCPRLSGTVCTIYDRRPTVCGRYHCQLLQDLKEGRKPFEEARAMVTTAKQLLASARAAMPEGMAIKEVRQIAQDPSTSPDRTELKLRAVALEYFLDQHFRNSNDLRSLELTPVTRQEGDQQ